MQYIYKDYEAIFEYLKAKAIEYSDGQWTDFTDGDFGTIIIHLLSYWGDLMSGQLDMTASELFMSTAEERTSLMEIVKLVGYEPNHYQSSIAYTDITYKRVEGVPYEPYQIPAFTKFYNTAGSLTYYNLYPVTLTDTTVTVPLYEGEKGSILAYYDDVNEKGQISLGDYYVATNAIVVSVVNGATTGELRRVTDARFVTGEMCYSVHVDLDGIPYIQFPTYWSNVLSHGSTITVNYLKTNGVEGRTGANTITKTTTAALSKYDITNPEASVGGYNPETVTEIKTKASIFARTMYSIVTLKDFEDMSYFTDDIIQVRALDYNNKEEEFPPSIPAYKQPTPPNGVPNDAYKVLIMAVPTDISTQTIFTEEDKGTYSKLTRAAQQLQEIYDDRRSATLYMEYRDPIYINPWLILSIYLDEDDLNIPSIAQNVVDYLKVLFNRGRVQIGESIYGAVIGQRLLNSFSSINYIEVRDPEYNIEAKPYEYVDINNGYHQIFVNDKLKYVPRGLQLIRLTQYEKVRLKDENGAIKQIEWCAKDVYDSNKEYVPNSYEYIFDKATGSYPRLDLEKVGVLYEDNTMMLAIPDKMLELGEEQTVTLKDEDNKRFLHIYGSNGTIDHLVKWQEPNEQGVAFDIPSYVTHSWDDEGGMVLTFTSAYTGDIAKSKTINPATEGITITKINGDTYTWKQDPIRRDDPEDLPEEVFFEVVAEGYIFYIPLSWEFE